MFRLDCAACYGCVFVSFVCLQKADYTERRYTLIRSKMNIHKINISSLFLDELLHVDVNLFYPDVNLRLFPIAVFLR